MSQVSYFMFNFILIIKKQINTVDLHSTAIEQLRSVDPMVDGVTLTNVSVCCPDLTETMFLNVLVWFSATCGFPPMVQNARSDSNNVRNLLGSIVTYRCNSGFSLQNPSISLVACLSNGQWTTPYPVCQPIQVSCGLPRDFQNARQINSNVGQNSRPNDSVSYECLRYFWIYLLCFLHIKKTFHVSRGFMFSGNRTTSICGADGRWTTIDECIGEFFWHSWKCFH